MLQLQQLIHLELQNMYSARLVCHADSSSTFQTKLCDMILHDTIDIQKREVM
jgi:predicted SAM-dependent methyltransferase